jgi:hypothetical protein
VNEIRHFLSDYYSFRHLCDSVSYDGVTSPIDGVFYPGVSLYIPEDVVQEVADKLERYEGKTITINTIFLRLSLEGVVAPHQAHTDLTYGKKSLMLYLTRDAQCQGGTAILKHVSGIDYNPKDEDELAIMQMDQNNYDKWMITNYCDMQQNKAFIFDAGLIHRAEPVGGFGKDARDGRLVLTAFYDC